MQCTMHIQQGRTTSDDYFFVDIYLLTVGVPVFKAKVPTVYS